MKAYKDFIISPIGERYNNSKKVGDKELVLNTEVYNHQYVNRLAKVIATPLLFQSPVNVGDEVIVHHNIFRRWYDIRGNERNSGQYFKEDLYFCKPNQIYLRKKNNKWILFQCRPLPGHYVKKNIELYKVPDKLININHVPLNNNKKIDIKLLNRIANV